jgi:tight adherence protein C
VPLPVWFAALAVTASIPILWWSVAGNREVSSRLVRENLRAGRPTTLRAAALERPASERLLDPLLRGSARLAGRFLPTTRLDRIEDRLASAGMLGRATVEQIVGAKLLLALVPGLLLGVSFVGAPSVSGGFLLAAGVLLGWSLPNLWLISRGDGRLQAIELELPDVLDQLTILVEAGLGFEAALMRVGRSRSGPLAEEIGRTMQDIQLGMPRGEALEGLAVRTGSADVRHLVLALRQAEKMGVPLARTLRIQSDESRAKRRSRAEEAAYKLPVKMIFPLALCILPALFIVILAPAVIQFARSF